MSYLLALIGTRNSTESDIEGIVDFHLYERPAFWTNTRHARWAKGTRVAAKVAGAGVVALTGWLDCVEPEYDPLVAGDQVWDWRYDMRWDAPLREWFEPP